MIISIIIIMIIIIIIISVILIIIIIKGRVESKGVQIQLGPYIDA